MPSFTRDPVVLIIPLIVRSVAAVPSSATLKVLDVAAVRATGHETVAPLLPLAALITFTFPPSVRRPLPEIVAPAVVPPQ